MRSGLKGTERTRTPVASKMALPRAAATGAVAASPAPDGRQFRMTDQRHFDDGRFGKSENRVAGPIHAGDAGAIELHFLVQGAAERRTRDGISHFRCVYACFAELAPAVRRKQERTALQISEAMPTSCVGFPETEYLRGSGRVDFRG